MILNVKSFRCYADNGNLFKNFCVLLQTYGLKFFQVKTCLSSSLLRSLHSNPADIECLRVYIIIPEVLSLMPPEEMTPIGVSFAEGVFNLQNAARKVLGRELLFFFKSTFFKNNFKLKFSLALWVDSNCPDCRKFLTAYHI